MPIPISEIVRRAHACKSLLRAIAERLSTIDPVEQRRAVVSVRRCAQIQLLLDRIISEATASEGIDRYALLERIRRYEERADRALIAVALAGHRQS